jgi:hypothetical protein
MSFVNRLAYVIAGTIANAVHGMIYLRVGIDLISMGAEGGEYAGPFSSMAGVMGNLWLVTIIIIQIGLLAYLIYGGIREEKAVGVVPQ